MLLTTGKILQRQKGGTNMVKREALQHNTLRFLTVFPKSPRSTKIQSYKVFVAKVIVQKCILIWNIVTHTTWFQSRNSTSRPFFSGESRNPSDLCGRVGFLCYQTVVACERFASRYHARILAQKKIGPRSVHVWLTIFSIQLESFSFSCM